MGWKRTLERLRGGRGVATWWLHNVLVGGAIFGVSALCIDRGGGGSIADLMWPASGIGVASIVLGGMAVAPGLLVGAFLLQVWMGLPLHASWWFAVAELFEATLGAVLLVRVAGFRPGFTRLRDLWSFLPLGVVGGMGGALAGSLVFCGLGGMSWAYFWPSWNMTWLGNALGLLTFAPPILCWKSWAPRLRFPIGRYAEAGSIAACVAVSGLLAWTDSLGSTDYRVPIAFGCFVFPLWAALRFGSPGAAVVSSLVALLCAWGTAQQTGVFGRVNNHVSTNLLLGFQLVLVGTSILTATMLTERNRADRQRRELEARLQQKQKLESLGLMAGGIAHDFNNLLTPIVGGVGLVERDLPDPSVGRDALADIERASSQLRELCRQMLAYTGRSELERSPLDLGGLLVDLRGVLERTVEGPVRLIYDLAEDLPAVDADDTQLRQVVLNLVANASDAMHGRIGPIRVVTRGVDCSVDDLRSTLLAETVKPGSFVVFEVADVGEGMTAEVRDRMFDPFFTTKGSSRGLGLAATLGIVRAHEGTIAVESSPESGTKVAVYLPASAEAPIRDEPAVDDCGVGGDETILIVDDQDMVLQSASRVLRRNGYSVLEASDGRAAVELFRELADEVSLVLVDLSMPGMNGHETGAQLQRIREDVCIVLSSGYDEYEVLSENGAGEFAGFLQKPYSAGDLCRCVWRALRESRPTHSA